MLGSLYDALASDGFDLVAGAFLASLVGHITWRWQERQNARATRKALGGWLHGELVTMSPRDSPIYNDPPTAARLVLNSVPQLLAPGVLNPRKDWDLYMHLIFLASVVDNFNDKARIYNDVWASGEPPGKLQLCFNDLQMSNWDYQEAHEAMMRMVERLGPALPLGESREPTLRERIIQAARKLVQLTRNGGA